MAFANHLHHSWIAFPDRWLPIPSHGSSLGFALPSSARYSSLMAPRSLLRQEFPWLLSEVVLLVVLMNANPPELWFWLVVFLMIFCYRIERWWASRS